MCWSLEASVASLVAGLWAPLFLIWFLATADLPSEAVRLCIAIVALLVLPAFVQLGDTLAHLNDRGLTDISVEPIAILVYASIALQPAVLAWGVVGSLDIAALQVVLVALGVLVVLHLIGCLAFDAPLERWLVIDVVHRQGSEMAAIVHGFYAYGGGDAPLFGCDARVYVYFGSLLAAVVATCVAAVRLDDVAEVGSGAVANAGFVRTARIFVILLAVALWLLLMISVVVVNWFTRVRGHVSSVWCQVSLVGLLVLGVYLTAGVDGAFAAAFVLSSLGAWFVVFVAVRVRVPR